MINPEHPIVPRALPENMPPGQAFHRCESHDIPMLFDGDEWVCAIESLRDCLEDAELAGFEFRPIPDSDDEITLSLVFSDGHVVPLLCADCGNAVEDEDDAIQAVREQIAQLEQPYITDIQIGEYPEAPYPWLSTLLMFEVGGELIDVEFPLLSLYYMTHPNDPDAPEDNFDEDTLN